jgi:predicted Rossmann-fold nucleotide-binding protein
MKDDPDMPREKPAPAHPEERTTDLPWKTPKPASEDIDAPALVAEIMRAPNYLPADRDVAFLNRSDNRGLRLQLDYSKAETLLEEHGVAHSIVVFGSTRVPEPAAARRKVEELERQLAERPDDTDLAARLRVARVLEKSRYYEVAREFGRIVGRAEGDLGQPPRGRHRRWARHDGGRQSRRARGRRAHVGLNISLPHEQYPNPYLTPSLCFQFRYFAIRKLHFLLRARALVVFPGGFGTMDELFETLTLIQTRKVKPVPVILVGQGLLAARLRPGFPGGGRRDRPRGP